MISRDQPEDFERLLAAARPELHRYCARLVGSVFDGEDVVQDVMLRALSARSSLSPGAAVRPWLFRIAHNRAIDFIRARDTRARLTPVLEESGSAEDDPFEAVAVRQAMTLAIDRFIELAPIPRSIVILKDVLGATNEEIRLTLGLSLQSVKAHLHRARATLGELAARPVTPRPPAHIQPETQRYAELFNARDWDGLQKMLIDDVRLIQTSKTTTVGRERVAAQFFAGYEASSDWRVRPASVEGREVIWVEASQGSADYFMVLEWSGSSISVIKDYRYARYIADSVRS